MEGALGLTRRPEVGPLCEAGASRKLGRSEVTSMKCGKCGRRMAERIEEQLGLKIRVQACPGCGKRLIDMVDAARLQRRALARIEDVRSVVTIGNSIGITLPAELKKVLRRGDKIRLIWDSEQREARLSKV